MKQERAGEIIGRGPHKTAWGWTLLDTSFRDSTRKRRDCAYNLKMRISHWKKRATLREQNGNGVKYAATDFDKLAACNQPFSPGAEAHWCGTQEGEHLPQVFECHWCDLAPGKASVKQGCQKYQRIETRKHLTPLNSTQARSCWNSPVEDKNTFKQGQAWRRVSRMVREMENLFYERSHYKLNFLSLGKQRRRYDHCKIHWGRR